MLISIGKHTDIVLECLKRRKPTYDFGRSVKKCRERRHLAGILFRVNTEFSNRHKMPTFYSLFI